MALYQLWMTGTQAATMHILHTTYSSLQFGTAIAGMCDCHALQLGEPPDTRVEQLKEAAACLAWERPGTTEFSVASKTRLLLQYLHHTTYKI